MEMDPEYTEEEEDRDLGVLKRHAAQIMEHFDTVQVFATRHESDGTVFAVYGAGNYYARLGQTKAWMLKEKESFREQSRNTDD